ncbi:MAG: hypothetical protein AAEJ04_08035 [Planctomycetota bacterium]
MRSWSALRHWYYRWRLQRRARQSLLDLFQQPQRLKGTSLKPVHFGRCDVVEIDESAGVLRSITFEILRHPRPHPFSRQHHLVAERWSVQLPDGKPERCGSVNLSRLRGTDGEPPGSFP